MEVFKILMGFWVYFENSLFYIGGVFLFFGFVYLVVGLYMVRVWWVFDFWFEGYLFLW